MIRLYGHMKGSFRTVTLGLQRAFQELGVLDGVFLGENAEFEEQAPGGADAPIAVVCGDPMRVLQAHYHGRHQQQLLMLAPNSEGIPQSFVRQLKDLVKLPAGEKVPAITGLLAPSKWAVGVLQREFPDHRVIYCPHGVLPEFQMVPELRELAKELLDQDVFRILHVSSSRLSRKCTKELVVAWQQLRYKTGFSDGSRLDILINPEFVHEFQSYVNGVGAQSTVQVVPGQNFKIENYVKGMQGYNFVVQPSRAEGFGLVPLEARACGVPAISTRTTGHLDHMHGEGVVVVDHGDLAPSDDYLGATAPTVSEDQIFKALEYAYGVGTTLHNFAVKEAESISKEWQWERVVAPAVEQMKELL